MNLLIPCLLALCLVQGMRLFLSSSFFVHVISFGFCNQNFQAKVGNFLRFAAVTGVPHWLARIQSV